jgi:phosphatidyl-myo-inositol dimannoside synthase
MPVVAPLGLSIGGGVAGMRNLLALITDGFGASGGIASYNRHLLTALAQCDSEMRIIVLPRHGGACSCGQPVGVQQLAPRRSKLGFAATALRLALSGRRFDAIFCGHLHLAPLAAVVARLCGAPLWLQLHGVEAWNPIARWHRRAAERAALITAVSRYTRQRFLRLGRIDPLRVRILPNAVGQSFTPGPKPEYLLDRHALRGRRVLLTVGRLAGDEQGKGHDRVIRALPEVIARCPDALYLVVGGGGDRQRLEALAQQIGMQDHIRFVGMAPPGELADYYRLADAFVMPSIQEGFGIVFIEAAACGLRPIGGNRDGSADALADGAIGLTIDPHSPEQLVQAIMQALAGCGPDPAEVERYRFENFARQVRELADRDLRRDTLPIAA